MPETSMKPNVLTELQRQFNQELSAAHSYLALAAWCHHENLKGFARYFSKQAIEERGHAQKIMEHLLDRDVLPKISAIDSPRSDFDGMADIAQQAQSIERGNTAGIHRCYEAAQRDGDYAAQVLLHWFINEQVEEEHWSGEMVDRVRRASCSGGVAELDRHIERYLGEEGFQAGNASE
jgi:ferritin